MALKINVVYKYTIHKYIKEIIMQNYFLWNMSLQVNIQETEIQWSCMI